MIKTRTRLKAILAPLFPLGLSIQGIELLHQFVFGSSAERKNLGITIPIGLRFRLLIFFEYTMKITATKTKSTDSGPAWMIGV